MKKMLLMTFTAGSLLSASIAKADNAFTVDQLVQATQLSLQDYEKVQPDMAKSISGFKTATAGNTVQVVINMNADGMNMTAKYLCVLQGAALACRSQQ
jgi:phosphotransferase system IIB component